MKYVQATIVLGLAGWLSLSVYNGTLSGDYDGHGRGQRLGDIVMSATEQFGVTQTSLGIAVIGLLLAAMFLTRKGGDGQDY